MSLYLRYILLVITVFTPKPYSMGANNNEIPQEMKGLVRVEQPKAVMLKPHTFKFDYIVRKGSKRHRKLQSGTFQLSRYDSGNYNSRGQLVGTNRSIAASTYESFTGQKATLDVMKNLTFNTAYQIYYHEFWHHRMNGHLMEVHNPIILDIIFNAISSSYGTYHFKQVLYDMTGFRSDKWKVTYITPQEVKHFNEVCSTLEGEENFYRAFFLLRDEYYRSRSKRRGMSGLSKWVEDYDIDAYKKLKQGVISPHKFAK